MPEQLQLEGRAARGIGLQRVAGDGAHRPARGSSTCGRLGLHAQQQRRHARVLCRQLEAARGRQPQVGRISPQLDHRHANAGTAQNIRRGAQHSVRIRQHRQQQPARIDPKRCQPRRMQSQTARGPLFPQPDEWRIRRAKLMSSKQGGDSGRTGDVARPCGEQLVQLSHLQSAVQRCVKALMLRGNQRDRPMRMALPPAGKLAQQANLISAWGHMFTLCSYRSSTRRLSTTA